MVPQKNCLTTRFEMIILLRNKGMNDEQCFSEISVYCKNVLHVHVYLYEMIRKGDL